MLERSTCCRACNARASGSVSDHAGRIVVSEDSGYDPPLRGVERDALPEMPIDSRPGAARADGAGLSSVPLSGLREAVQRTERWFTEPDAISERRDRARRGRLRYKLSLRDLAEMFLIRGIVFSYEAEELRRSRKGKSRP